MNDPGQPPSGLGLIAVGALAIGAGTASVVAFERLLESGRAHRGASPSVRLAVGIRAPIDAVWGVVSDLPGQPRWMGDLKRVRVVTPGPAGKGTRAVGLVRIFGIALEDPIEISAWEPPRRFAIRHLGIFRGQGEIRLGAIADTTVVDWEETLVAPMLPEVVGLVTRPVFRRVFAADLRRLRDLVEGRSPS